LTDEECDRIIDNAGTHLIPCVIKNPTTGAVEQDPSRTSTNANMPQSDVPSIVEKVVALTNCPDATHLESLQVLKYTRGQTFQPHTDGFHGPTTACGFEQSGRLVTVFCYLNNVEEGGGTRFTKLRNGLTIAPRKGMAVVHFPTTTGFEQDLRTEHEGTVAMDDKWLLVTWMWKHPRTDPTYAESLFPSIINEQKR
jgi:prolyl 4-hydroxylase